MAISLRFSLLLLLLAGLPASAQPAFHLVGPTLLVDGEPAAVNGAPIRQASFGYFTLTVPGHGTYVVAGRPFEGARRAGQFDGRALAFTAEGRSVRLRAAEPILDTSEPVYAYVRLDPSGDTRARGPALVSLTAPARTPTSAHASAPAAGPAPPEPSRPAVLGTETEGVVAARRERVRLATEITEARREREELRARNTRLEAEVQRLHAERERLDAAETPLDAERDRLRAEIDRLESARAQALDEQADLAATRRRLAQETAALERDLGTYAAQVRQYEVERDRLTREREHLAGTRRETAAFTAALGNLEAERRRLVTEQGRLEAERTRLTGEAEALRRHVEALGGETARLVTERDRLAAEQGRLVDERDALRDEQTRLLAEVRALRAEAENLSEETRRLAAERDHLRAADAPAPDAHAAPPPAGGTLARLTAQRDAAAAERDEYAVTTAALRREVAGLEAHVRDLEAGLARGAEERRRLLDDNAQLARERDALHREAERLRATRLAADTRDLTPRPSVVPPRPPTDGPSVTLPGFDWSRLQNPAEVRRLAIDTRYPALALQTRAEGDALVVFATDDTGRVVEAAVAEPLGGGLDAVAERIVRTMHFIPPVVSGLPTGLRSQVVVRFQR